MGLAKRGVIPQNNSYGTRCICVKFQAASLACSTQEATSCSSLSKVRRSGHGSEEVEGKASPRPGRRILA